VGATHLGQRRPGARVNLEVDLIGKYVERLVAPYQEKP
jgi:riboflavin synthase alpha subunit